MPEQTNPKPWWEANLEWTLTACLQERLEANQRRVRGIPETINAHHLEQPSHIDGMEPDPVEKIAKTTKPMERIPRAVPPPPKPPCLEQRNALPPLNAVRGVNMPAVFSKDESKEQEEEEPPAQVEENKAPERKFTLEQLLDPDYCGYTS